MTQRDWFGRMPWSVVAFAVVLMALGCLGIARAEALWGTSHRFLGRQLIWIPICLAAMLAASIPAYRVLTRWSYALLGGAIVLLVVVYWFPTINGAHRWIRLGPVGFQPSEFAKLAFVLGLSRYLMYRDSYRRLGGLLIPLVLVLIPVLLILREPDLGTALVFLPVMFIMLAAAGARRGHLALLATAAVAVLPALWTQMSREQKSRVTALAEQTTAGEQPTADGYHLHQAKQVMSLGGWTGRLGAPGISNSGETPFVPEPHTDSIAIVLAEQFGILGWSVVLMMFLLLAQRGLAIGNATREPFGRLVAVGIAGLLLTQACINMGMLVGLLPITGLALPLVSYGGSSLLANSLAIGLLINIGLRPGYEVTNEPFRFVT